MTNDELRLHLVEALEEMKKKALDMKIRGVGVAAVKMAFAFSGALSEEDLEVQNMA